MIAHWMLYSLAVGVLLCLGAAALEAACRALRLPARWCWVAAVALTLGLPLAAWTRPAPSPSVAVPVAGERMEGGVTAPVAETVAAAANSVLPGVEALERPLAAGWALSSAGALALLAAMWGLLAVRRRRWAAGEAGGVPVLYAPDTGPAVVGLLRGRIVLPEWAREAEPRVLDTMVAHEREHLRAGDHRLVALGLLAVVAMPWSPAAWWQLRRLRLAVEVDCDARVLRRSRDVHAYGRVLLEVGARARRSPLAAPALTRPTSFLERRIRIMTSPRVRHPRLRAAALGAAAAGLLLAACDVSTPAGPAPADVRRVYAADGAAEGLQPSELTPRAAVERYYPDVLTAGAGENALLTFVVSAEGRIVEHRRATLAPPSAAPGRGGMTVMPAPDLGLAPETIHSIDVLKMAAGRMGPDPVSILWVRQGEAGALRAAGAGPQAPAFEGLRATTDQPMRAAGGAGDDVPVVIRDAAGEVVAQGRSGDLDLAAYRDRIDSIEVVKGGAAPTPDGEIRIRLAD
jgi:hypothetical protein